MHGIISMVVDSKESRYPSSTKLPIDNDRNVFDLNTEAQENKLDGKTHGEVLRKAPHAGKHSMLARRKPTLLLRLSGVLLLRFATRQFCGLLFQLPPRMTRFVPSCLIPFEKQLNEKQTKTFPPLVQIVGASVAGEAPRSRTASGRPCDH